MIEGCAWKHLVHAKILLVHYTILEHIYCIYLLTRSRGTHVTWTCNWHSSYILYSASSQQICISILPVWHMHHMHVTVCWVCVRVRVHHMCIQNTALIRAFALINSCHGCHFVRLFHIVYPRRSLSWLTMRCELSFNNSSAKHSYALGMRVWRTIYL